MRLRTKIRGRSFGSGGTFCGDFGVRGGSDRSAPREWPCPRSDCLLLFLDLHHRAVTHTLHLNSPLRCSWENAWCSLLSSQSVPKWTSALSQPYSVKALGACRCSFKALLALAETSLGSQPQLPSDGPLALSRALWPSPFRTYNIMTTPNILLLPSFGVLSVPCHH